MAPDTNEYCKHPALRPSSQSIIICCSWKGRDSTDWKNLFSSARSLRYFLSEAVKSVKTFTGKI